MIDPLLPRILAVGLGLMWFGAAWHKLGDRGAFREVLAGYRLLPAAMLGVASWLLPAIEAMLAAAWLLALRPEWTVAATAALLAAYAAAIAINLLRGHRHIACGCGFSPVSGELSLSWTLVLRNLVLALLAAVTLWPQAQRALSFADLAVLVLTLLVTVLLHMALTQLLRNRGAFRARSHAHD